MGIPAGCQCGDPALWANCEREAAARRQAGSPARPVWQDLTPASRLAAWTWPDLPIGGASFAVGQVYQNAPTTIGGTLSGYGKIDSINSLAIGSLCSGCELTYQFGGFSVTSITGSEARFSGGWLNFYIGFGADNDFNTGNAGGSAGDIAEATNGTLFLSLKGHSIDAAGNTLVALGANIGTSSPIGFSTGLMDVDTSAGGLANANFNSNGVAAAFGGAADLEIGSSFSALHPVYAGECPGGAACLRGSVDATANVIAVPEPETYALLLAGLGVIGMVARRRRA
jgi:hypothetical protein